MKGWRCLDCDKTWLGPAVTIQKVDGRKQMKLTRTGEDVKAHILIFAHTCAPESNHG